MMRHWQDLWRAAALAVLILAAGPAARAEEMSPKELMKKVLDAAPHVPFVARMKLSSSRGWTRELELRHKRIGDADMSYMEVTAPHDVADTRFLMYERVEGRDQQFIYVPAVKRAVEIVNEARKQQFLGSDFFVSDMVAPELEALDYAFVGGEEVGGRHCKLIEGKPKNPQNEVYSKSILAVDPTDLVIVRTQFFDPKGNLLKVWTVEKLEKRDGHWTPLVQKMENVQSKTDSQLEMTDVQYDVDLPDNMFERAYLIR